MSKRERTKQAIINSAMKLFAANGYKATSVNELVNASGIAKGTYYYHFEQKEDVLRTIIEQEFDRYFEEPVKIAFTDDLSASVKMNQLIGAFFSRYSSYSGIETYFDNKIPDHLKTMVDEIRLGRIVPLVGRVIKQGIKEGVYQVTYPDVIASIVTRGIIAHIDIAIQGFDSNDDFVNMVSGIEELLTKALGHPVAIEIRK